MRFAKVLRFGRTRTDIGVDLNNLLNTNYATGYNTTYMYSTRQRAAAERLGHADQHLQPAVRPPELHGQLLIRKRHTWPAGSNPGRPGSGDVRSAISAELLWCIGQQ